MADLLKGGLTGLNGGEDADAVPAAVRRGNGKVGLVPGVNPGSDGVVGLLSEENGAGDIPVGALFWKLNIAPPGSLPAGLGSLNCIGGAGPNEKEGAVADP